MPIAIYSTHVGNAYMLHTFIPSDLSLTEPRQESPENQTTVHE
jgi:hypothetical protein